MTTEPRWDDFTTDTVSTGSSGDEGDDPDRDHEQDWADYACAPIGRGAHQDHGSEDA